MWDLGTSSCRRNKTSCFPPLSSFSPLQGGEEAVFREGFLLVTVNAQHEGGEGEVSECERAPLKTETPEETNN